MDDDFRAAVEFEEFEESLCPGCGRPRHETFDPEHEEAYEAVPLACHACAERDRKARIFAEQENAVTDGVYFVVREDSSRDKRQPPRTLTIRDDKARRDDG